MKAHCAACSRRTFLASCLAAGAVGHSAAFAAQESGPAANAAARELIRDPHFQAGFRLIEPEPGKRIPYGTLRGMTASGAPVWDLDQWSSKHSLKVADPEMLIDGALRYANAGKTVTVGKPGTARADMALGVIASAEYGDRARRGGEPWVHLLMEQPIENPPALAEIRSAVFHIEARLLNYRKVDSPDYSPGLHAAQYQVFFSVQNLNRKSQGYGNYLWFGIPIYDNRSRYPAAHKAQDTGGTSMFIFTPGGDEYTRQSAHDREWLTIHKDILPMMREGLETAWKRGFLRHSQNLADYRIAGMNIGWELPGTFDVEVQIRNLSLATRAVDAAPRKSAG